MMMNEFDKEQKGTEFSLETTSAVGEQPIPNSVANTTAKGPHLDDNRSEYTEDEQTDNEYHVNRAHGTSHYTSFNLLDAGSPTNSVTSQSTTSAAVNVNARLAQAFHSNGVSKTKAPFVSTWLESNYEAQEGVSLPRSTLYAHYLEQCRMSNVEPVNAASFGKIIRAVFPNLKTRRLGTRGNSKYHYYGIKLKNEPTSMGAEIVLARCAETKVSAPKPRNSGKKVKNSAPDSPAGNSKQEKIFTNPNTEEFLCVLQEHCNPIPTNVPPHISLELLQEFCINYRSLCQRIISLLALKDFGSLEPVLKQFWQGINSQIGPNLNCEEACRIIGVTDDLLHQAIIEMLLGNVLDPISINLTQQIRHFAKNLEVWLMSALEGFPMAIVDVKLECAKRFTHILRRRTSLNHLAQAARTVLQNPDQVNQMLHDWSQIDFDGVKEQASWIVLCRENIFESVEESFRTYLRQGVSLEFWAEWLEGIVEECLVAENGDSDHPSVIENNARQFLLKWSFYSTLIMRDLTLRSASSFGSFHLMRLLYDEYIFYLIERKIEDIKRRCFDDEQWNTESLSVIHHPQEHFSMPNYGSDVHKAIQYGDLPARGHVPQFHAFHGTKEVFDDYTNVYFADAGTGAVNNNERNYDSQLANTGRVSQLLHDIGRAPEGGSPSVALNAANRKIPRQDDTYANQKKKIRMDVIENTSIIMSSPRWQQS